MAFKHLFLASSFAFLGLGACASVDRVDPKTVTDISGEWNDTDSRLVAEEMITDCVARPWLANFKAANGARQPVVIIGSIRNRSDEHIPVTTFTKDMEKQLINSGQVRFVANKEERSDVREEREDQQVNSAAATMKRMRQETGADYMIIGNIDTIVDAKGGKSARTYQVNLELVSMETNEKVWIGTKDIKKVIKKSSFGF